MAALPIRCSYSLRACHKEADSVDRIDEILKILSEGLSGPGYLLRERLLFIYQRSPFDNSRAEFPGDIIYGPIRFFPFYIGTATV